MLTLGATLGLGLLASCARSESTEGARAPQQGDAPLTTKRAPSPIEDLAAEHGVLSRILLVYEQGIRRLQAEPPADLIEALSAASTLVRRFVEDYHQKLEENFVFPRFDKARSHEALVASLRRQHAAARALTDDIQRHATGLALNNVETRTALSNAMQAYVRMYRPHEAREDSVLFPAFAQLIDPKEYAELGERFEVLEHQQFGREGRNGIVRQVETLEQHLRIGDLDAFTPA